MKKLIILIILIQTTAFAQDAHLSMYDAAPLYLNPALTGVFDGQHRFHIQYRTQWKSVNFKPYTSALFSYDMPFKKWGFGVQIYNFRAGYGNYNAFQGLFSGSYNTALDRKRANHISFGIQAGLTQKSIEYQLLSFDNQYSLANGGTFDQTLVSGENFAGQSDLSPVVNASLMYYNTSQKKRLNPFIGFSAFNLITPKESFFQADNRLPMRFYLHAGTRINITELFYLIPKVLIMQQQTFFEQTYAVEAGYFLKNNELYLLAGAIFRTKDAMIVTIGAKKDNFILKLGYDINVSRLTSASNGRGGFELSFTYILNKKKSDYEKICPRL